MWICPNCEKKIDSLDYSVSVSETGYCSLSSIDEDTKKGDCETSDHESNDTSWSGDPEYFCPECSEDVDINEMKPDFEKEEIPKIPLLEEEKFDIIKPEKNIQIENNPHQSNTTDSTMICKHCLYVYVYANEKYGNNEEFIDCPKCGESNEKKEYLKLIQNRFYEQIKIKRIKKHAKKTNC